MPVDEKPHPKHKRSQPDWEGLRILSLRGGGFGEERVDIWPKLLNVSRTASKRAESTTETVPHEDERQIGLDTDRSFVLYPVESKVDRETLQKCLRELLVAVFRKRPKLSYFQGYHDIATVFFLTLPEELQLLCVEKISLHRLRDSMGQGLEPVLGLLRVTKNLLQLADPEYARMLEQVSPMPFYALSNLLTLFAHDMPTLPLIQHVFDYLLCRPPIAVVYLATAIILARKAEAIQLEEDDEDGMIHSLLSSLPDLIDDHGVEQEETPVVKEEAKSEVTDNNSFFTADGSLNLKDESQEAEQNAEELLPVAALPASKPEPKGELDAADGEEQTDIHAADGIKQEETTPTDLQELVAKAEPRDSESLPTEDEPAGDIGDAGQDVLLPLERPELSEHLEPLAESTTTITTPQVESTTTSITETKEEPTSSPRPPLPPYPHSTPTPPPEEPQHDATYPQPARRKRSQIVLTDLLQHADDLYATYPPSHPGLALSSIMGPQSVVFTWSESFAGLPADDEAEAMIAHPELVVYPLVEVDPHEKEEGSGMDSDVGWRKGKGKDRKRWRRRVTRRLLSKAPFGPVEKKTMLAGTVLVLGVAMAVYGMKASSSSSSARGAGAYGAWLLQGGHANANARDWRRVGGWVGGALAGISQKILNVAGGHRP
ncbi:hypothetical protein D9619_007740 [Psilocybe cf. subviscida]|uniref:Rab-GAP TBC domain-containing protein n=1 Tax=Psilocybe cf. subviscida TaxID=2480587 RepID=A0A8H5ESM7_9AGAR|nr:hypothetical protein D9619_007740 [Psilocybe cf. subviscida]